LALFLQIVSANIFGYSFLTGIYSSISLLFYYFYVFVWSLFEVGANLRVCPVQHGIGSYQGRHIDLPLRYEPGYSI